MKRIFLILLFLLSTSISKAAPTLPNMPTAKGCFRVSALNAISITYSSTAAGTPIYLFFYSFGTTSVVGPTSMTPSGSDWIYTYDIASVGLLIAQGHCISFYAWWDNTLSYNDVTVLGSYITLCPCIDITSGCYRVLNNHLIADIVFTHGADGDPIYIWVNGSNGPLAPISMVQQGSNWVYSYDLSTLPIWIVSGSCLDILAWRDQSYSSAQINGSTTRICPCRIDVTDGCYRLINGKTLVTMTYGPDANGNDIFIWADGNGPVAPTSKTFDGTNWLYTYDVTSLYMFITVGQCLNIVAYWDNTASYNDALAAGTSHSACRCLTVIDGCYNILANSTELTIIYNEDAQGADIFTWVNGSGPLAPISKTFNGNTWVYKYDLTSLNIDFDIVRCLRVYAWWKSNAPITEVISHGLEYKACPCKIEVIESCIAPGSIVTIKYGQETGGNPINLWGYSFGSPVGPIAPISITAVGGNWEQVYDLSATALLIPHNKCIDLYAWWNDGSTYSDVIDVAQLVKICPCCNAEFSHSSTSTDPYKVTFTPNSTYNLQNALSIDMDFGDGNNCTNCTLPITHIYAPGTYTVCMAIKLRNGKSCRYCYQICIAEKYQE